MIGIFGGTFDPIHNGHIGIAKDVLDTFNMEQVRFIPVNQAVHKKSLLASADQRLAWVSSAISHNSNFICDDREISRSGNSYSIDTLQSLKIDFPKSTLCLLLGTDAFKHFLSWKQPVEILKLAHLVVMQRPNEKNHYSEELNTLITQYKSTKIESLNQSKNGRIFFHKVVQLDISSTQIRNNCALNQPITNLISPTIEKQVTGHYQNL